MLRCAASIKETATPAKDVERGCADIERGEYGIGEHVLQHTAGILTAWTVRLATRRFTPLTVTDKRLVLFSAVLIFGPGNGSPSATSVVLVVVVRVFVVRFSIP